MSDSAQTPPNAAILSCFLDDENPDNIAIFVVREVLDDSYGYFQGGAVQARAETGWRLDPGTWLKYRQEYGDVGDHSLLTDAEAQDHLNQMGLELADGHNMLIDHLTKINGAAPTLVPVDPNFKSRRDEARAALGLPEKS